MKILMTMLAVKNAHVTREALDSFVHQNVDIILCANGADEDIKQLFKEYQEKYSNIIDVWDLPENIAVNPGWNLFMKYFLENGDRYTHLCLHSNDVIFQHQFIKIINKWSLEHFEDVMMATEVDKNCVYKEIENIDDIKGTEINGGVAGFSIWLNRKHVKNVFPIPNEIKIWFGDEFIYSLLRGVGYKTIMLDKFLAHHIGSATLKIMDNTSYLIEQDKNNWITSTKFELNKRIIAIKNGFK